MTNGEAVIAKLISEVADLTKANGLLHGIVSNREEEISGIRAQLAQSEERVSKLQAQCTRWEIYKQNGYRTVLARVEVVLR